MTGGDPEWSELARRDALTTPWFTIAQRTLRLPNGSTGEFFVHEAADTALCVCVSPDREVLLEWQYRPAIGAISIDHPAGRIEEDDPSPADAVIRELHEETGFVPTAIRPVAVLQKDPGFSAGKLHVFLAEGLVPGRAAPEDTEQITARWVPATDVLSMIADGDIACAFCVSATYLAFGTLGWLDLRSSSPV